MASKQNGVVPVAADDELMTVDPRRQRGYRKVVVPGTLERPAANLLMIARRNGWVVDLLGDSVNTRNRECTPIKLERGSRYVARDVPEPTALDSRKIRKVECGDPEWPANKHCGARGPPRRELAD